jgi:transaldolase/glucose-6-phosphate isomerase
LPDAAARDVARELDEWLRGGKVARLWARDASLWTGADESVWLGWLDIIAAQRAAAGDLAAFGMEIRREGFTHALLLGMGGSSLAPEVLARTFGIVAGAPALSVLDSTDPAQVRAAEARIDLERTLFIVSSKSGSTLEPNVFMQYFLERTRSVHGEAGAAERFVAITDPGSQLDRFARASAFRRVFAGVPSIGGRYSALSSFGTVPAAVAGLDVARLLDSAGAMARACGAPAESIDDGASALASSAAGARAFGDDAPNPGVTLGVVLGVLAARHACDKITLVTSAEVEELGAWLEQLLAESTGKHGRGLIPVDREPLGAPGVYGADRLFVHVALTGSRDAQDAPVEALERAGHPVIRLAMRDRYDLGAEFFRWEIATAVAGAILGVNPFDQPDVEASKVATRKLTSEYERQGALPTEKPLLEASGLQIFADERNAAAVLRDVPPVDTAVEGDALFARVLRAHLARLAPGDYFAILAYIEMSAPHARALESMRVAVRDAKRVATSVGFGPRFLHSTGQAYKGGPNSGVFLQITCDDDADLPAPDQRFTFGVIKAAQARGDFDVLSERSRRALRIHIATAAGGVDAGLARVAAALRNALV